VTGRPTTHGRAARGSATAGRWWPHAIVLLAVAAVAGATYANSLQTGFALDSRAIILANPALRDTTWANVVTLFSHDYWHPMAVNGLYRPLTTLTYLFNYSVLGNADRPAGYHAVNLLLHIGCAALLYALLVELGQRPLVSGVAAALFAVHPIATEAVTNIVGRADLLGAAAVLIALLCHARAPRAAGGRALLWRAGLGVATLAGALCKESAVVILGLVVGWDLVVRAPQRAVDRARELLSDALVLLPPLVVVVAARAWVAAHEWPAQTSPIDNPMLDAEFWSGRMTAVRVVGLQLWSLVWPAQLCADYSFNQIPLVGWPPDAVTVAGFAGGALLLGLALCLRRRVAAVSFLLVFFLVALLPAANLIVAIGSIRADRFLYLPSAGLIGAVVIAAFAAAGRRREPLVAALFALALLVCAVRTARRNVDWTSDATLWASTVACAPNSAKAQLAYANTLAERSPPDLDGAVAATRRALAIRPDYLNAQLALGRYLILQGDALAAKPADLARAAAAYGEAVAMLEQAIPLDRATNRLLRARMLARGDDAETIPDFGNPQLYRDLGLAHARLGRFDRAQEAYLYARHLDPWVLSAYIDVSAVQASRGQLDDAATTLLQVLALDQRNTDALVRLTDIYHRLGSGDAVIADGPGRVRVNLDAPLVRRHRCAALRELAEVFAGARLPEVAANARRSAEQVCPQP
jgi:tetratricopeptide (TPR) repeat protein